MGKLQYAQLSDPTFTFFYENILTENYWIMKFFKAQLFYSEHYLTQKKKN